MILGYPIPCLRLLNAKPIDISHNMDNILNAVVEFTY